MEEGGALEHLEYNVALNSHLRLPNTSTAACDWSLWQESRNRDGESMQETDPCLAKADNAESGRGRNHTDFLRMSRTKWDLIIGSDLIYNDVGVLWLPRVLNDLIGQDSVCYYCHTKVRCACRRYPVAERCRVSLSVNYIYVLAREEPHANGRRGFSRGTLHIGPRMQGGARARCALAAAVTALFRVTLPRPTHCDMAHSAFSTPIRGQRGSRYLSAPHFFSSRLVSRCALFPLLKMKINHRLFPGGRA